MLGARRLGSAAAQAGVEDHACRSACADSRPIAAVLTLNTWLVSRSVMQPQGSDQAPVEDQSPLGVTMMIEVMESLARTRAPAGYRVVYRTNPRGEHVVAIIWPQQTS
jgi:hypothetical protein